MNICVDFLSYYFIIIREKVKVLKNENIIIQKSKKKERTDRRKNTVHKNERLL